jgi:hypothetical protein
MSTFLGGRCPVSPTTSGAPITTPKAYIEIKCPAEGMEICNDLDKSGKTPIIKNSVMPMQKPPNNNEIKLNFMAGNRILSLIFMIELGVF